MRLKKTLKMRRVVVISEFGSCNDVKAEVLYIPELYFMGAARTKKAKENLVFEVLHLDHCIVSLGNCYNVTLDVTDGIKFVYKKCDTKDFEFEPDSAFLSTVSV